MSEHAHAARVPPVPTAGPGVRRERAVARDPLLAELAKQVVRARRGGPRVLAGPELDRLPALYRYAATRLSLSRTDGRDPRAVHEHAELVAEAHALLYRDLDAPPGNRVLRALRFLGRECPRAIRAEWRLLAGSLALFYGLALLSYVLVARDLELAFSFLDPGMLQGELEQLRAVTPDRPFRGNFTFGLEESASTAGLILAKNITVTLLFFASGLVPPLFLLFLVSNGLMVGTYLGVASHWGQADEILSILMCHGTLELQALALAGAAGLALARGLFLPGVWTRRHALRRESRRAWRLAAGVIPMLVLAGLIEGYISPHAPEPVRAAVMALSALLLVAWISLGGAAAPASGVALVEPSAEQHAR